MNCSANNGNATWTEINEIDMRGQAGGADLAVAGGASAWSANSNSPANAFDEGASLTPLRWASPAVPGWISYVFRDPVALAEMVVEAKGGSSAPRDFTIERSNDHQVWTVARTVVSSTGWASNERRVFGIG